MIDEDRYYDSKFEEYMTMPKVPFEDYKKLEEKHDELLKVINACIESNDFAELKEYMEEKYND